MEHSTSGDLKQTMAQKREDWVEQWTRWMQLSWWMRIICWRRWHQLQVARMEYLRSRNRFMSQVLGPGANALFPGDHVW